MQSELRAAGIAAMASAGDLRPILRPWLTALRQRSEHTATNYAVCCERFLRELGDRELDPDAVADYLESLRGLAPGSRAAHISAVRSFLRVAQSQGLIEKSPVDLLIRPTVAITSYGRYLDLDELRRLVAAAKDAGPMPYALVLLLATTGLRISEAAGAEWRDLYKDPSGRLGLRVVHGKGGKERVCKMRDDAFQALATVHGSSELDASDRTPLLPSPRGGSYSTVALWQMVKNATRDAQLTKPASPHWLRHTAATLSAHGGASAFEIQAGLGHSRLDTAARYVHMARGLERTMTDALPAFE